MFKLFTIADEQKLWDSLPRYVAEDLSKVPFLNADSVSTINLSKRLEAMDQRILLLEQTVTRDNSGGMEDNTELTNAAAADDSETDSTWAVVTRKKSKNSHKSGRTVKNDHSLGNRSSTSGSQPVANANQSQQYKKKQKVLAWQER